MALRADEVDLGRDRDLVERYQAGDPSAFDELYQRYFDRLRAYCHRRVGDGHIAEEIAQESFIRALGALPRFAGERRFYPWMTVIAQRLCVDHHRRNGRVTPSAEVDTGTVDAEHDHVFHAVDVGYLALAMERLGPRHREVLKLREQEGWTYQQIADHLEVPMTTVEALLHRARKALRREFLAVGGDGRLVAIPVLGWALRSLHTLRARIGDRLPELSSLAAPVAAGAMTVALAVAPVIDGAVGDGGDGGTRLSTTPATSVVDDLVLPPEPAASAPVAGAPPAPSTPIPAAPAAGPAPDSAPRPAAVDVAAGAVFVGPGGNAAAEEESEGMDTTAIVGDVWLATDAEAIVPDVNDLENVLGGNR